MDREWQRIAEDIPGSEGPVFDLDDRFFMVCPNRGQILRVDDDGTKTVLADTGGIPAGLQVHKDNTLWCADMKRCLLHVTADGQVEVVVDRFEDGPMPGCNDCYFDGQGHLYFTAPAGSGRDQPIGKVFCRTADGDVTLIDEGMRFPNGLAVTDDDRTLIVAETMTRSLWAYDVVSPGKATNKRLFAEHPGDDDGGGDGMDFDVEGNLLVAHYAGSSIDVFAPDGTCIERVATPFANPTNVHFRRDDSGIVYVTEISEHTLWRFRWDRPGQKQFCDR